MAVSLAKVADVDRNMGNENAAVGGFQEGIKLLESLTLNSEEYGIEKRVRILHAQTYPVTLSVMYVIALTLGFCAQRLSVLEFLNSQVTAKLSDSTPGDDVSADKRI